MSSEQQEPEVRDRRSEVSKEEEQDQRSEIGDQRSAQPLAGTSLIEQETLNGVPEGRGTTRLRCSYGEAGRCARTRLVYIKLKSC
ncbi:MAG: hypothetical protein C4576_31420 [Desulfobacteraceae bacterium]|nr:MAG: hypothetical protein C4576_31420 [Desulfobacteraceae bacterium]